MSKMFNEEKIFEELKREYKETFGKEYEERGFTGILEQIQILTRCLKDGEPLKNIPEDAVF